jgi:XTP/dITP diphosphohydrolase
MHRIVFATNNRHKVDEVTAILDGNFKVITLKEIPFEGEIPEEQNSLEGNALQKVRYIHERCGLDCMADDTGLEVEALSGAPGVYSARYAGPDCIAENNIRKLLDEMNGLINRKARFRTVAALIYQGKELVFEGVIEGEILYKARGTDGFGYDPVFQPLGYHQSFAEMSNKQKNTISHRALAFRELALYLNR